VKNKEKNCADQFEKGTPSAHGEVVGNDGKAVGKDVQREYSKGWGRSGMTERIIGERYSGGNRPFLGREDFYKLGKKILRMANQVAMESNGGAGSPSGWEPGELREKEFGRRGDLYHVGGPVQERSL